jgi:hypothetical protein
MLYLLCMCNLQLRKIGEGGAVLAVVIGFLIIILHLIFADSCLCLADSQFVSYFSSKCTPPVETLHKGQ